MLKFLSKMKNADSQKKNHLYPEKRDSDIPAIDIHLLSQLDWQIGRGGLGFGRFM